MKNEHCRASFCSYRTRSEANKRISVSILGAAVSFPFALKRKGSGTYNKRFRINAVMRSDEIAHGIRYSDADGILTVMRYGASSSVSLNISVPAFLPFTETQARAYLPSRRSTVGSPSCHV